MNMAAIEKINTEMQKNPTDQYTEIVGQYIIDRCADDQDGAMVAKDGKTLPAAMVVYDQPVARYQHYTYRGPVWHEIQLEEAGE